MEWNIFSVRLQVNIKNMKRLIIMIFIIQTKYKFGRNNNVRIWSDDEKNIKFIVITEWIE